MCFYMQSVEKKIEKSIKGKPKGTILLSDDFAQEGSAESVRKALQNLKEKGLSRHSVTFDRSSGSDTGAHPVLCVAGSIQIIARQKCI